MKTKYVVVADEAIARILQWPEVGSDLESVEEMTDPDAHARGSDGHDDSQGRRAGSASQASNPGSHHRIRSTASVTASAGEDEQHQQATRFAKRVADRLLVLHQKGSFQSLEIVAAPRFLGLLRKELAVTVADTVTLSLNKDLIHSTNDDLSARLRKARDAA